MNSRSPSHWPAPRTSRSWWPLALLCLGLFPTTVLPVPLYEVVYKVSYGTIEAAAANQLLKQTKAGDYRLSTEMQLVGVASLFSEKSVLEFSDWSFAENRLIPLHYSYRETDGKTTSRQADIRFNWKKAVAINHSNGKSWPIKPGYQDQNTLLLSLMQQLSQGKKRFAFDVIDGRRHVLHRYQLEGERRIRVPAGEFNTVVVQEIEPPLQRVTTVWLAPELGYLPIKMYVKKFERTDTTMELSKLISVDKAELSRIWAE